METYLPLSAAAVLRYHALLAQEEYGMARQLEVTWGDRLREEGRHEGQRVAKRDALLSVLRARFAPVPEELVRRIGAIEALPALDALLVQAATAASLDDVRAALPG